MIISIAGDGSWIRAVKFELFPALGPTSLSSTSHSRRQHNVPSRGGTRLAFHGDSKPLLPASHLLSLGKSPASIPAWPKFTAPSVHVCSCYSHLPAQQQGWFPMGSGVSSRLGNRPFRVLLLSCPRNTLSPLFSSAACPSPSSSNRLLSQALPLVQPSQDTGQELLPTSPPCSPSSSPAEGANTPLHLA